ncbi:LuxR family transcriptional regulator [Actinomycetospora succinea]|uniref:LuxR family transcriptional regulator n=1 Tax=Actinomycetospora succinea TaxID=663603 RepID=A0A4R6VEE3_9PSEU|nr:AAA family ATPase [Actinomycetospora succinea]TDQ58868.1 LuxR family transcriptional regulator [Actinomycetospora succinea]
MAGVAGVVELLERDSELEVLAAALDRARHGSGSVVLVSGEAGVGKTSLVHAVARADRGTRVLAGACDDLVTPRTFGPFRDVVRDPQSDLGRALLDGDRAAVLPAVLDELAAEPTVLVVEDVHWADDATLDVLRFLARRTEDLPAVLVMTFREEEVGDGLRRVLGAVGGPAVHRLALRRLSRAAVARWAEATNATSAPLYALTGGNPFFVSEILAATRGAPVAQDLAGVPATVADAVLARVHGLDAAVRVALEQLAVVPSPVEIDLARQLVGDLAVLAPAEERGLLEVGPQAVAFRHELTRRAVEDAVPTSRRLGLNARVLEALRGRPDPDRARLVHHALGAGDDLAVVELGPDAAAQAARGGAFAQEVALYRHVLARGDLLDAADRAAALQACTAALFTLDRPEEALETGEAAVAVREELGDPQRLGEALTPLGPVYWALARGDEADATAERAVRLLRDHEGPSLAVALGYRGLLLSAADRFEEAIAVADEQVDVAERLGTPGLDALGRMLRARCRMLLGDAGGREEMADARRRAAAAHHHVLVVHTYVLEVQELFELGRYEEADRLAAEGLDRAHGREVDLYADHLRVHRHLVEGVHGAWEAAEEGLRALVGRPGEESAVTRVSLPGLARLLVRRGADDAEDVLAWAVDYARRTDSRYELVPALLALVEHCWVHDRPDRAAAVLVELTERTAGPGPARQRAEVVRWRRRFGEATQPPAGCPEPFASGVRGEWRAAAQGWAALGAPYEQALDLLDAPDEETVRDAFALLDGLGARPATDRARHRLRSLGAGTIPRGPAPATRANPHGLTDRQMTILRRLALGHTNAEIARELVVSVRTVDHHVSAVLQKLGVTGRREAAAAAASLGIT